MAYGARKGRHSVLRPKRQYRRIEKKTVPLTARFGWHGFSQYMLLCFFFGAPQAWFIWQISRINGDKDHFIMLSIGWAIVAGIYLIIARPWERRPIS